MTSLPRPIRLLGWVSLLTDAATEAVYPLLPVFITQVLGGPPVALGIVEGAADATSSILKVVAGRWSDRLGRAQADRRDRLLAVVADAALHRGRDQLGACVCDSGDRSSREGTTQRATRCDARGAGAAGRTRTRFRIPLGHGSCWRGRWPFAGDCLPVLLARQLSTPVRI